jgi:hypothetical protein
VDARGNVLDPVSGHVDFAATFAAVVGPAHAGEERMVRPLRFWERLLAFLSLKREPARSSHA